MLERIKNLFKRKPKSEIVIPIKTDLTNATETEKELAKAIVKYLLEAGEIDVREQ